MGDLWQDSPHSYTEIEDESRLQFLHPWLRERIEQLGRRSILDFGCGDGALFEDAHGLYDELCLFDKSPAMIELARARFAMSNHALTFAVTEDELPSGHFDLAVCCLVLMTVSTEEQLKGVAASLRRTLVPGGICLVAVTHPCFRRDTFDTFTTAFANGQPFGYFSEGAPFSVTLRGTSHRSGVSFTDFHWSLALTTNLFIEAGFSVDRIVELPDEIFADGKGDEVPAYLLTQYSVR